MPTERSKLSNRSPYYLPKHRFLELKHFCLQYWDWKKELADLDYYFPTASLIKASTARGNAKSTTIMTAIARKLELEEKISLVDEAVGQTDPLLQLYILEGVTKGLSYEALYTQLNIPCSRDTYYDRYRKFFKILDSRRS